MNCDCIWRSISIQYVQIEPGVNSDLGNGSFGSKSVTLRVRGHYVKFDLTRLRFSKFPWQLQKNGEYSASKAIASTQRRCLRWRRWVCCFSFFVTWLPRPPFVDSSLGGKRLMSNHSHRRESSAGDKVLSLSSEIVHFAFTDITVDSCHPLSAVQSTTIEVACRT